MRVINHVRVSRDGKVTIEETTVKIPRRDIKGRERSVRIRVTTEQIEDGTVSVITAQAGDNIASAFVTKFDYATKMAGKSFSSRDEAETAVKQEVVETVRMILYHRFLSLPFEERFARFNTILRVHPEMGPNDQWSEDEFLD